MLDNFLLSMNTVLPLFAVLLAGFFLRRPLHLEDDYLKKSNRLCFTVFLPLQLFLNVYNSDLDFHREGFSILFCACGIVFVFFLACIAAIILEKDPARRGTLAQGMFRANYVILGLPMVSNLCGEASLETASVILAVAVPMFNILSVLALVYFCGKSRSPLQALINIAKNPLVLAVLFALLVKILNIQLPVFMTTSVKYLANVATGLMLFVMGASLHPAAIRKDAGDLAAAVLFKLILSPAIILAAAYLLGFRGPTFATILILFATPTALSSFPMATQMGGDGDLASEIVVFTTGFSLLTLMGWIFLFLQLGAY